LATLCLVDYQEACEVLAEILLDLTFLEELALSVALHALDGFFLVEEPNDLINAFVAHEDDEVDRVQ
jgi:hypothetical protein